MSKDNNCLYDIAIIGGGAAGMMGTLRAVLNHLDTLLFLGGKETVRRSRATWVKEIENIPGMIGISSPILNYAKGVYAFIQEREDLTPFLTSLRETVQQIEKHGAHFELKTEQGAYLARFCLLCTGTMDVQPQIGGSIAPIFPFANRGDVYYCIRCDGHKIANQPTAVMGHTAQAAKIALLLFERYAPPKLWLLTNGKTLEADEKRKQLLESYGIEVISHEITKVLGDAKIGLQGFQAGGRVVPARKAIVALGTIVYNELAKQLGVELDKTGHILANEKGETSIPGFYAAGDLRSGKKKQVYTAWDMAVDAVDDIDLQVRRQKRQQRLQKV